MAAAAGNGVRPHVDLDELLGDRAKIRDVTLGGVTYQFRPINLYCAKLLSEGKHEDAFAYLILDHADDFLAAAPAAALGEIVNAIYGEQLVEKAEPPRPTSAAKKAAPRHSKPTSSAKGSP